MSAPILPDMHTGVDLETRFKAAANISEQQNWGARWLAYLTYTDPEQALAFARKATGEDHHPLLLSSWKTRGFLANLRHQQKEAIYAYQEALQLAEQEGAQDKQADILLEWSAVYVNAGQINDAERMIEQAARLIRVFPRPRQSFHLLIRQASLKLRQGHLHQAFPLFRQAERMHTVLQGQWQWDDLDYLTLLYSGLGEWYTESGERQLARDAYFRVIRICENFQLKSRLAWYYLHAGAASMALERFEDARQMFLQAIDQRESGQKEALAGAWANLGFVYLQLEEPAKAKDALDRAADLYQDLGPDKKNLAVVATWRARLARLTGQADQVMSQFVLASEYAREIHDNAQLSLICKEIARHFADQKDFKNAYEYLLLHDEIGEKAREELQQTNLMELQVKYETEQKEQEAETLRGQAVELRLKAMRAQMNPHFLFNALNGIQNFIHQEDGDKASRYLAKFAGLVRQSLNLSNTELITLEDEVAFIQDYLFINQKLRFDGRLHFEVRVDDEIDEDRVMIPPMMVQPFVENAIEHGFTKRQSGTIVITFDLLDNDVIRCAIQDDGIGREEAIRIQAVNPMRSQHQSLGIGITRERLDLLNRSGFNGHRLEIIDLKDDQGHALGTRVELYFPSRRKGI
ncbi:MAG: histidine kinase [Saprospiraceae bacterium]